MTTVASVSTNEVREMVVDAAARGAPLRVAGRGTWLDAGRPVAASEVISTRDLSGITEYVPGDLTLTARAGTTLSDIRDATRANGQWLALDPPGSPDESGTLGATVATASAGPLRTSFGSPRDLVLGLEFVTGAGVVARGGGRVVKNVAGFDLTRLLTGSWGTIGVITEVTVRLHARPEADESVAVAIERDQVGRVRQLLRRLPFTPYACEILNAPLARLVVGTDVMTALFRLGGNREAVRAQRTAIAEVGASRDVDERVWEQLRSAEPRGAMVFRLSRLPSEIDRTWSDAEAVQAACKETLIHASAARGVVRCIVPPSAHASDALQGAFGRPMTGSRIGERLPAALWQHCAPSAAADRLSAGIKRTFDPRGILNPGILGEPA